MQLCCNSYDEVYEYTYIKHDHSPATKKLSKDETNDGESNHEAHECEFQKISKSDLLFGVAFSN